VVIVEKELASTMSSSLDEVEKQVENGRVSEVDKLAEFRGRYLKQLENVNSDL